MSSVETIEHIQPAEGVLPDDDSGACWEPCGDEFFIHSLLMLPQNECDHPVAASDAVKCENEPPQLGEHRIVLWLLQRRLSPKQQSPPNRMDDPLPQCKKRC